jgi:phage terminase large subunit-like protein
MVNGTADAPGLMGVWPAHQRPQLRLSKDDPHLRTHNGAKIQMFAAHQSERFRGPQADGAWADEIDSWKPEKMSAKEAWSLFELGIRLGPDPRIVATSTPKRARLVKMLMQRDDCVLTTGSTWDNAANLAPQFMATLGQYKGTHLESQELKGEVLEDVDGALLSLETIDAHRVDSATETRRNVVGVDPSGSVDNDRQGIIVAGVGKDGDGYVLADRSCRLRPEGWGRRAVEAALEFEADRIVVEVNYGGDMAVSVLRQAANQLKAQLRIRKITASRAKQVRFEPVCLLYEQGHIHHVGSFPALETELCAFTPDGYEGDGSPDAADALVWAMTDLMLERMGPTPTDLYGRHRREKKAEEAHADAT